MQADVAQKCRPVAGVCRLHEITNARGMPAGPQNLVREFFVLVYIRLFVCFYLVECMLGVGTKNRFSYLISFFLCS